MNLEGPERAPEDDRMDMGLGQRKGSVELNPKMSTIKMYERTFYAVQRGHMKFLKPRENVKNVLKFDYNANEMLHFYEADNWFGLLALFLREP